MIRLGDAALMAFTKLRTRRVRLGVTVVIASLLFGMMFGVSLIARGVFTSVERFSGEAFGNRFIIQAIIPMLFPNMSDPELVARAEAIQKDLVARKKAEAKRLGIPYGEHSERPVITETNVPTGGKERMVNFSSEAGIQALKEKQAKQPSAGLPELQKMAKPYGATQYYRYIPVSSGNGGSALRLLKDGKESYTEQMMKDGFGQGGLESFTQNWSLMSDSLLEPFLLPNASLKVQEDGTIPVVVPYSAVEELLKFSKLPSNASPEQKLQRLEEVRKRAASIRFEACYRNAASQELISTARTLQTEIAANKNNKNYVQPTLVYDYPKAPCGEAVIARDVRQASEKTFAAKQKEFDRIFGKADPAQQMLRFQVVGIAPDPFNGIGSGLADILQMFAMSSLGMSPWITPLSVQTSQPLLQEIFTQDASATTVVQVQSYFVEFKTAAATKKFVAEQECRPEFTVPTGPVTNPFEECAGEGKHFLLMPFGSNSLALDSAKSIFQKVFSFILIGIGLVAAIILMGLLGRMIADSRKETAVFRAIGAKRIDISVIYLLYVLACIVLICLVAGIIGLILSQILVAKQQDSFTVQALLIFNSQDLTQTFDLRSFYVPDALKLFGAALAAGIVSSIVPLMRNVRRNPIKDMRDD